MIEDNDRLVGHGPRLWSLLGGVACAAIAVVLLIKIGDPISGLLQLSSAVWFSFGLAGGAILLLHHACRAYPIIRISRDGLSYETQGEHRSWEWRQTGRFHLSPPPNPLSSTFNLVALYPGNAEAHEQKTGRSRPDFVEADISIDLKPFLGADMYHDARAILEKVERLRARSLQHLPLDNDFCGGAATYRPLRPFWVPWLRFGAVAAIFVATLLDNNAAQLLGF